MANDFLSGFTGFLPSLGSLAELKTAIIAICGFIVFFIIIFWFGWYRKQWNIKVEFKIPRGINFLNSGDLLDNTRVQGIVNAEWGKGSYDAKKGTVWVKRKGKKKVAMKPFDVKKYLQGDNILSVVQVGVEDYRPVLTESYLDMIDETTGEEAALLKIKIDTSESKAWKNSFERESKNAYSITNLLKENAHWIAIGLVIFLWGIQFLVLYNRMKG
jgi:hypothetical protein